jgi:putative exosortase-associated protein (TIGR04073 family)
VPLTIKPNNGSYLGSFQCSTLMMKKHPFKILGMVLALAVVVSPLALADTLFDKLGRGVTNVVFCPGEYVRAAVQKTEQKGLTEGLFIAVFSGTYWTVIRALAGVYEIATFPIPLPRGYKPIMKPEFVFNDVGMAGSQGG